jgi:soluble lytic murein transglycosylase
MLRLPVLLALPLGALSIGIGAGAPADLDADAGAAAVFEPEGGGSSLSVTPDSALEEFEAGRYWHAARILLAEPSLDLRGRILLARAEAGYRNWGGVLAALEGIDGTTDSDTPSSGIWSLRALALDELGRDEEASAAWAAALDAGVAERAVPLARRARIAWAALAEGRPADAAGLAAAVTALDLVEVEDASLAAAVAAEAVEARADAGDTAAVRILLDRARGPFEPSDAWELPARVALAAADSAGARARYTALLEEGSAARRGRALEVLGDLALARGDSVEAAGSYLRALRLAPGTTAGQRAARGVVDLTGGEMDAETALAAARALDRLGDGRRALAAYDRYVEVVSATDDAPSAAARLERARIAATVPSRVEEAVEEFRALDEHPDPAIGARTLEVWAALRRRQGQTGNYRTLRGWLVERYPDTDAAAEIVFLRADAAQDRGAFDSAISTYEEVARMAPSRSFAGQARMRIAQILLGRGEAAAAADVYEAYLADFPTGRRWEEAAYWAARLRLEKGDEAGARRHIERLTRDAPLTYYSVRAAGLVGEDFRLDVLGVGDEPAVPDPMPMPTLDLLEAAGLESAADAWVEARIAAATGSDDTSDLLRLAEALNARGRTLQGINLGWRIREMGTPWTRRLVEVVYPFIYREMVLREAAEWGLDPVLVSALIRQESAWVADIRSSAGAIGLMQVMPQTGAQVARSDGMSGFTPEALETPEVNLHLGARFLRDLIDRYGEDLPLVLSAYNAGPSRADRWKGFPEYADRERFTERIPFAETRGYVKNVTRNVELYEALYGNALRPVL